MAFRNVFFQCSKDFRVIAKHFQDCSIRANAHSTNQNSYRHFSCTVNTHIENVIGICFIFQPSTTVRNHRCRIAVLVSLVHSVAIVHTRATDNLGDDNTFSAVDHKGAAIGHHGEITHENRRIRDHFHGVFHGFFLSTDRVFPLDFFPSGQFYCQTDGFCISGVPLLALFHCVLRLFIHGIIHKRKLQVARVVLNGGNILEHFPKSLF